MAQGRLLSGGLVWATSAQFFLAQALAQRAWAGSKPYSLRHSWISDLGAATCGSYSGGGGALVCSPRRDLPNGGLYLLGGQVLVGVVLLRPELSRTRWSDAALGLLVTSGVALPFIGAFPEDTGKPWHAIAAGAHFATAGLGMVAAGFALTRERRTAAAAVTLLLGGASLVGTLSTGAGVGLGVGRGPVERLAAWPFTLWTTAAGLAVLVMLARRSRPGTGMVDPAVLVPGKALPRVGRGRTLD